MTMEEEMLSRLMSKIAESSPETCSHLSRVAEYSKLLGAIYGLSKKECDTLQTASKYHEIGKILIPNGILNRPGKLTTEEFTK